MMSPPGEGLPAMPEVPPQHIPIPTRCISHIHVDLECPLPPSKGFTHLFIIIDRTSRWPQAIPISASTTVDCLNALFQGWVTRFRAQAVITSDHGAQYTSSLWPTLCNLLNIQHTQTTAYHLPCPVPPVALRQPKHHPVAFPVTTSPSRSTTKVLTLRLKPCSNPTVTPEQPRARGYPPFVRLRDFPPPDVAAACRVHLPLPSARGPQREPFPPGQLSGGLARPAAVPTLTAARPAYDSRAPCRLDL